MERRNFLKQCGLLGGACFGIPLLLESCSPSHFVQGAVKDNIIKINKADFVRIQKDKTTYRKNIIVKFDGSDYPIALYRFTDTEYAALLMKCTHQGNELSVNGNLLTCAAHGSEFSDRGEIVQGPADQKLRSFPVSSDETNIYIKLI